MKLTKIILSSLILCATAIISPSASAQDAEEEVDQVMHTFGAISAQAIFANYMAIAELGDLYGHKAYEKEKVVELATLYTGLSTAAKESLTALVESESVGEGDDVAIKELIIINDQLISLSKSIITYVEDPTEDSFKAYDTARQRSWKSITKFLGLE